MHIKRWITGLVTVPFLVLLISKGGPLLFAIIIAIVSILALQEYFRIVFNKKSTAELGLIPLVGFITSPLIIGASYINSYKTVLILIALNLMICALISLKESNNSSYVSEIVTKQIMGIIYIPLFISHGTSLIDCGTKYSVVL